MMLLSCQIARLSYLSSFINKLGASTLEYTDRQENPKHTKSTHNPPWRQSNIEIKPQYTVRNNFLVEKLIQASIAIHYYFINPNGSEKTQGNIKPFRSSNNIIHKQIPINSDKKTNAEIELTRLYDDNKTAQNLETELKQLKLENQFESNYVEKRIPFNKLDDIYKLRHQLKFKLANLELQYASIQNNLSLERQKELESAIEYANTQIIILEKNGIRVSYLVTKYRASLDIAEKDFQTDKARIEDIERKLNVRKRELFYNEIKINELKNKISKTNSEMSRFRKPLDKATQNILSTIKMQIYTLQNQIKQLTTEYIDLFEKIENIKTKVQLMELNTMNDKIANLHDRFKICIGNLLESEIKLKDANNAVNQCLEENRIKALMNDQDKIYSNQLMQAYKQYDDMKNKGSNHKTYGLEKMKADRGVILDKGMEASNHEHELFAALQMTLKQRFIEFKDAQHEIYKLLLDFNDIYNEATDPETLRIETLFTAKNSEKINLNEMSLVFDEAD